MAGTPPITAILSKKHKYRIAYNPQAEVDIGDYADFDFKPQVKIKRWGDECYIKVSYPTAKKINPVLDAGKLKWKDTDKDIHFYPLDSAEGMEDGGFEFEIVLKEKPATNIIELDIQAQGLDFFYQPALTPEEIDAGNIRHENVIGSYAVYHTSRGNVHNNPADAEKYRAGKAFHIYRPKITDASGKWTWGILNIDTTKGKLAVEIPPSFLDGAVYPVTVDPTFGYTTAGASGEIESLNYLAGSLHTSPADVGTGVSISAYTKYVASSGLIKGVTVLHSTLAIITNGVGAEAATAAAYAWVTSSFGTAPTLSISTDYVLCIVNGGTFGNYLAYDTGITDQGHRDPTNSYAAPTNPTDAVHNTNKYSVYMTYNLGIQTYVMTMAGGALGGGAAAQSVYEQIPFTYGPVAAWRMNENAGTSLGDSSGHGNTGTLTGTPLPSWVTGKYGSGLQFDGTNNFIIVPNSATLMPKRQFTLAAWIYKTANGDWKFIMGKDTAYGMQLTAATSTPPNGIHGWALIAGGDAYTPDSVATLPLSTWKHVVVAYDGAYMHLYVDDVEQGTGWAYSGSITEDDAIITLAADSAGWNLFTGILDDVFIYDRALSPAERTTLMNGTAPGLDDMGAIVGGTAGVTFYNAPPTQTYTMTMDGGGLAGGACNVAFIFSAVAIGGALAGGASSPTCITIPVPAGGAVAGGLSIPVRITAIMSIGGALAGGDAPRACIALPPIGGGALAGGVASYFFTTGTYIMTMAGGALGGGTFPLTCIALPPIGGGAIAGGAATFIPIVAYQFYAEGGAVAGGLSIPVRITAIMPIGGALAGGTCSIVCITIRSPAGGAIAGGNAGVTIIFSPMIGGGGIAGGAAAITTITCYAFYADGGGIAGGAASNARVSYNPTTGGAIAGGIAGVLFFGTGIGFHGIIDEMMFFNRALTQLERNDLSVNAPPQRPVNLAGAWKLDEGMGSTVRDSSGNGNTGVLKDFWVPGQYGNAGYFDGVSQTAEFPNYASPGYVDVRAFSFWFKADRIGNGGIGDKSCNIIQHSNFTDSGFWIEWRNSGSLELGIYDTDKLWHGYVIDPAFTDLTGWHHIAGYVNYITGLIKVWFDKVLKVNYTYSYGLWRDSNTTLRVGSGWGSTNDPTQYNQFFKGKLNNLLVYERHLSQKNVDDLYNNTVDTTYLLGWWKFNESSGIIVPDAWSTHPGAIKGVWVLGQRGLAFKFGGANRIEVPHSASLVLLTGMTLACWLKKDSDVDGQCVIMKGYSSGLDDWGIYFGSGADAGKVFAFFRTAAGVQYTPGSTNALTNGTWVHVGFTYDGTTARCYIDKVQQGTGVAKTGNIVNNGEGLGIGGKFNGGNEFHGTLDETYVLSRALDQTEFNNLYDGILPTENSDIVSRWRFEESKAGFSQAS